MKRNNRAAMGSKVAALLALALGLAGCGYNLVGRASNLPPDIKKVYLKPIENRTPRQSVDQILTRALADEIVKRQRFALTSSRSGADAELSGAVISFGATPVTFDQSGRATAYEIGVTAQIVFKRLSDDKVIWSNSHYTYRESYPIDPTGAGYFDRETTAIETVAKRFSETMISDLLEGF
jgi:outer membrane lipopolysaccharide assembly protein LptE/RlpB